MADGMSAADYAAISNNSGLGGIEGLIGFAIIASMFGFGGGGFGGWGGQNGVNALNADMQRGFDTQNLQSQTRDIMGAVTNGTAQAIAASTANAANAINAIKDGNANIIREFGNVETGIAAIDGNLRGCCSDIKQMILGASAETNAQIARNNYDAAMRDAATNANFTAQIQGVKDMIQQDKIETLQAQVSQLQLAQATAGMLRFPSSWTYGAGPFPPIFGCPGGNI